MTAPRTITEADRRRVLAHLAPLATAGHLAAIRNRALFVLAWSSALRVSELVSLDLEDVCEPQMVHGRPRLVSRFYLSTRKAKGRHSVPSGYSSAGTIVLTSTARQSLAVYLEARRRRDLLPRDELGSVRWSGAVWLARGDAIVRLSRRSAQQQWRAVQIVAGIRTPYRFHDLRHTAISTFARECNGDAFRVAAYARHSDVRTSLRYVHADEQSIADIAERMSQ